MARWDGIAALVMLLGAVAVIREAATLHFGSVRDPGPGFVPWWAGVTLAGLSLILLAQAPRRRRAPGAGPPAAGADRSRWPRVVGLLLALALYTLVLDPLGYPIATFLLVLFMLRPATRSTILPAFGLAVLAAGGSYVLFAVWLKVPLPPGPWLH